MAGILLKRDVRLDRFLDELVGAAIAGCNETCSPPLESGAQSKMEQNLRQRFREILRLDMAVGEECGLSIFCKEGALHEPWSEEAERVLREEEEAKEE